MSKVFLYENFEGNINQASLVNSAESMIFSNASPLILDGVLGNYLLIEDGGIASYVSTKNPNAMVLVKSGGTIEHISLVSGTSLTVESNGTAKDANIGYGAIVTVKGKLDTASVVGTLTIDGSAQCITISKTTASVMDEETGKPTNMTVTGTVTLRNTQAALDSVTVSAGWLYINAGSVSNADISKGGTVRMSGGAFTKASFASGSSLLTTSRNSGIAISEIALHTGSLARFYAGTVLAGTISIAGTIECMGTINASSATADFRLSEFSEANKTHIVNDCSLSQFGNVAITINPTQASGAYKLAGNAETFSQNAVLKLQNGTQIGTITLGQFLQDDLRTYALNVTENSTLLFSVLENNHLRIGLDADYNAYVTVLTPNSNVTLHTASSQPIFASRKKADSDQWTSLDVNRSSIAGGAQFLNLAADQQADIVIPEACGVWQNRHLAQNTNTLDYHSLCGMNRYDDVLHANGDATLLLLSSGNDALFADDIYTDTPNGVNSNSTRLANLTEIRANDGDDLVDMTMLHATEANPDIAIRGGKGDDLLWAGNDGARLFGDTGNDTLVGGNANDILTGGAGNDTLRGLAGNNIYAFGENFGSDTVILNDDEEFRIWLDDALTVDSLEYSDNSAIIKSGENSITILNIAPNGLDGKVLTGSAGHAVFAETDYTSLLSLGAFSQDSTKKIFAQYK